MSFVQNFPLFTIILSLVCAVISFAANDRWARGLTLFLLSASICMQAALLVFCAVNGTSYSYMMGHYPAPWGNEITVGVLESFMALWPTWLCWPCATPMISSPPTCSLRY